MTFLSPIYSFCLMAPSMALSKQASIVNTSMLELLEDHIFCFLS